MRYLIYLPLFFISFISSAWSANCTTYQDRTSLFGNMEIADGVITPYEICTPTQLRNIRFYPDKKFILGDDLDFDYAHFTPIIQVFSGELNGNSKTISRLIINNKSASPTGIFETISEGKIENINFIDTYVSGTQKVGLIAGQWRGGGSISNISLNNFELFGNILTGALVGLVNELGSNTLTISTVSVSGSSTVSGTSHTGGLVGLNNSLSNNLEVQNITSNMIVKGDEFTGGLVGQTLNSIFIVSDINLSGNIECFLEFCGGVVGRSQFLDLSQGALSFDIKSWRHTESAHVGSIVGHNVHHLELSDVDYSGSITAEGHFVGGLCGASYTSNIDNVTSSGSINVVDNSYGTNILNVGGVIGKGHQITSITNSSSSMNITSHGRYVGGLAGYIDNDSSIIDNSYSTGDIYARTSFIGGLVGFFDGVSLTNSYATGNITIENPTPQCFAGGLVGYANSWNSNYQNIYALGNITITNGTADYLGGLVGFFRGGSLSQCYANGNVTGGRNSIGGLIGILRGDLSECYSIGEVTASGNDIGGLVGHFNAGLITKSFSISNVKAKMNAGGLIGKIDATEKIPAVTNSYSRGIVTKLATSTEDAASFGRFIGVRRYSANLGADIYSSGKNKVIDEATGVELVGRNGYAKELSNTKMKDVINFPGFDFTNTWTIRTDNWKLPNTTSKYLYPALNWSMN